VLHLELNKLLWHLAGMKDPGFQVPMLMMPCLLLYADAANLWIFTFVILLKRFIVMLPAGISPPGISGPEADDVMPAAVGVGFTDVGSGQPGTDR
jgi:hypothetical protein